MHFDQCVIIFRYKMLCNLLLLKSMIIILIEKVLELYLYIVLAYLVTNTLIRESHPDVCYFNMPRSFDTHHNYI